MYCKHSAVHVGLEPYDPITTLSLGLAPKEQVFNRTFFLELVIQLKLFLSIIARFPDIIPMPQNIQET